MVQKKNPIRFENSEGNLALANGLWDVMVRKFAVSRLQRDLSDSTVVRNTGLALGFGLLSFRNTYRGLENVFPNVALMKQVLVSDWTILSEAVQTELRYTGAVADPYSLVKDELEGKTITNQDEWKAWISGLPIPDADKNTLSPLTPETYLGLADRLTDIGLEEISASRGGK